MKIGFVSMPLSGHLNPMTALARRLQSRGNEVVFFGVPDVEPFARAAGLEFVTYGEREYPVDSIDKVYSSVPEESPKCDVDSVAWVTRDKRGR